MEYPLPESGRTYRHYKGGLYLVIGTAKHSETLEDFVMYTAMSPGKLGPHWIRPLSMWSEMINDVPRFALE